MKELAKEVWEIAEAKPWLVLWPVLIVALIERRNNPPWWLRIDSSVE